MKNQRLRKPFPNPESHRGDTLANRNIQPYRYSPEHNPFSNPESHRGDTLANRKIQLYRYSPEHNPFPNPESHRGDTFAKVAIILSLLLPASSSWAAPIPPSSPRPAPAAAPAAPGPATPKPPAPSQSDADAFAALAKSDADAHKTGPETAASYEAFLQSHVRMPAPLAIPIYDKVAALRLAAKDSPGAHAALHNAIAHFHNDRASRPLLLPLAFEQARLYIAEKQPENAVASLRGFKVELEAQRDGTLFYAGLLQTLNDRPALIDFVADAMQRQPALLSEPGDALFKPFIDALIGQGRTGTALQWCKLRFVACDFNLAAVDGASSLLGRVWLAQDLSEDSAQAFTLALQDSSNSNPLHAIPLPASFHASPASIAARVAQGKLAPHDHITMLLAAGDNAAALAEARTLLADPATAPMAINEVCRVLKARDLDLQAANAFLQYIKTGTGPNPLSESPRAGQPSGKPAGKWTPANCRVTPLLSNLRRGEGEVV